MPIPLGRPGRVRRWVSPWLLLAGFAIGSIAVSRVTFPQEGPKPQGASSPATPGEAELRTLLKVVSDAYNQADAKALSARFTDDAVLIDQDGGEVRGRDAIARHYADAFGKGPTCKISDAAEAIHFLTPEIASVVGPFQLEDEEGNALSSGRFGLIAVRKGDQWQLAELRDDSTTSSEGPDRGEPLRELEWMIGDWLDDGEDGKVSAQVRWDEGKKFLVRKYSVQVNGEPARSGTQWIGWDPQENQVRSWNFDSEGGFGQGQWTRSDGDRWIIKASGKTGDGLTTSATQIIELVNKDAVKFQSTDRVVNAEQLPDIDEVLMVRKPPAPESTPAPASEATPPREQR